MSTPSASKIINLYPSLDNTADVLATSAPTQDVNAFRLQKINDVQKYISVERNERERTYTKYN